MPGADFRFRGSNRDLTQAAAGARRSLHGVGDEAAATDRRLAGLGKTSTDTGRRFGYMTHYFATRAIFGLSTAIAGATVGLGLLGFNFLRVREQATIAFTTMLHSGEKARKFLDELQGFAARTPFEFPELIQTTQRMLAMGFAARDVIPALTAIGDQVADLGGGGENLQRVTIALGQMQLKGRVQSEEMLQLIEAGVNGWGYLAKAMGTTVAKAQDAVTKRTVEGRFAVKAILAGMERDHAGAMEKQSHTFQGLWSTIKDTISAGAGSALEPLYASLERGLQRLVDFMGTDEWTAGVKRFSDYMAGTVVPRLIQFGKWVFNFFKNNGATITGLVGDAARLVATLVRGTSRIVGALGGAKEAAGWILGGFFAAKLVGVGAVITRTVIPALVGFKNTLIGIRVTAALAGTQMTMMGAAGSAAMFTIRGALLSTGIGLLMVGLGLLAGYVVTHWAQTKEWFAKFWHWMKVGFKVLWETIKQTAKAFVYVILQIATAGIRGILEVAAHLPFVGKKARQALDSINGYIEKWKPEFSKVAAAAGRAGGEAFSTAFTGAVQGAVAGIIGAVVGAGGGTGTQAAIVQTAQLLGPGSGKVYRRGGGRAGPPGTVQTAYDCSGFLYDVYRRNGVTIPQTAAAQFRDPNAQKVALDDLEPGDGVYFINHTSDPQPGHCGIVVSGKGRGAIMIDYYRTGQPAEQKRVVDKGLPFAGGRRWIKIVKKAGTDTKTTTPAAVDLSVPDYAPIAGTGGAKKAKGAATAGAIRTAVETVAELRTRLATLAREGLGGLVQGVGARLDALSARIRKGMKADDLAALRRQLGKVKADIDRAFTIDALRGQATKMLQALSAAFRVETPRTEAQVRALVDTVSARIADLRARIKSGVDADTLKALQAQLAKLKPLYSEALDEAKRIAQEKMNALQEIVSTARSGLGDAFSRVTDKAMALFDAATDRLVKGVRVRIQSIAGLVTLGQGDLTPAERALRDFQAGRAAADLARRRAEEDAAFASDLAKLVADPATDPAEIQRLQDERAQTLRDRELDDRDAYLSAQADLERKAADDALQAEADRIQSERALVRERFAARLGELQKGWTDEKVQTGAALGELTGLLVEYGVDFAAAGTTLGTLFADSFNAALDALRAAINDLAGALRGLGIQTGINLPSVSSAAAAFDRNDRRAARDPALNGDTYVITGNTFLGATEREVGRSLERLVTPAQGRVVSYPAPA